MAGFVFTADCHLSATIWNKRPAVSGDAWVAFSALIDFCIQQQAPLLIGGDLFDKTLPDSGSVQLFCREMTRMKASGLPVYFIEGQHERAKPAWASCSDWPIDVSGQVFTVPGVPDAQFYGISWRPVGDAALAYAAIPPGTTHVLGHQVWFENMGDVVTQPEVRVSDVAYATVVLTGDFHQHFVKQYPGADGRTVTFVSPGALRPRNKTDIPLPAAAYYWSPQVSGFCSVTLPKRPAVFRQLASERDLAELVAAVRAAEAVAQALPPAIRQPFVVAQYHSGMWPNAYTALTSVFPAEFLFLDDTAGVAVEVTVGGGTALAVGPGARETALRAMATAVDQLDGVSAGARMGVRTLVTSDMAPAAAVRALCEQMLGAGQ